MIFLKKTQLNFIDGILYEDCPFGTLLFLQAKRVMVLEHYFYVYRFSQDSITRPKEITEERRILDAESWFGIIESLEAFPLGKEIIQQHIKDYYPPLLFSCSIGLQDNQKYIKMLKYCKYKPFQIFLLEHFPKILIPIRSIKCSISRNLFKKEN